MQRVILAGVDPAAGGRAAADWAEDEAILRDLPVRVVRAWPPDPGEARVTVTGLGLVPEDTAARAEAPACPLILVPEAPARSNRTGGITLGVDARRPADAAIDFAFESARLRCLRLHAVHAWALPPSAAELPFAVPEEDRATWEDHEVQLLADALRPWRAKYPDVQVFQDVVLFTPSEALLHHSPHAALVVVGHRRGSAWGDTTRSLLRATTCPVAVVPS
ncbi:universal stress protein [Streptomyces sp. HUAS TT20]|uniref:universal stress protein n=1 Tax=Streptomyces sp. HUAS TT20 TaxID=3447509 RepID=UPI0021DB45BC|nr:universal stress protein [Streptomyces sp. HUAS 15-9]UXY25680.1 universal stress protein [Streptomyces sp. HUAS 15-9]